MIRKWLFGAVVLIAVVLSACNGAAGPDAATVEPESGLATLEDALPVDYEDALSSRNQLALGTLRLEGTEDAVTAEQAETLAFLWQTLQALLDDSTTAREETSAVQAQILAALTAEQVDAIRALALTNADLTAFYAEQGVALPTPQPGVTPQSSGGGRNSGVSQEDREATRTAAEALGTPVGTGGGGGGAERQDILLDTLISLLLERAEG